MCVMSPTANKLETFPLSTLRRYSPVAESAYSDGHHSEEITGGNNSLRMNGAMALSCLPPPLLSSVFNLLRFLPILIGCSVSCWRLLRVNVSCHWCRGQFSPIPIEHVSLLLAVEIEGPRGAGSYYVFPTDVLRSIHSLQRCITPTAALSSSQHSLQKISWLCCNNMNRRSSALAGRFWRG